MPCAATTRSRPHGLYVNLAVRCDYSYPAARALRQPRRAPRLLVSGRTRSMSTSSCTARTHLHSPGCSDYFAYAARPGASARHAAPRLVALLVVDYSALRRLVVDYLASAKRPGASTRRASRHAARRAARRRILRLAQARHRLLRLRRASGCLSTSRGPSRGSSRRSSSTTPPRAGSSLTTPSRRSPSTTSPTPRVRVPRHVARLVTRLVVDYSVRCDFVLRPRWLYFRHALRRDYLSRGNTGSISSTPRVATTSSLGRITSTIHLD
jgi:hypothetical protein